MSLSHPSRGKLIALTGALCVVVGVVFLFASRTDTAPPGKAPGVPPADGRAPAVPTEGLVAPGLSEAEFRRVEQGETVEVKVGNGTLQIRAVKPRGPQ